MAALLVMLLAGALIWLRTSLLRASLPILFSVLVCGVLLRHLPPAHPSQAVAAEQSQTALAAQTTVTPGLEIILEQPALIPPASPPTSRRND